LRCLARVDAAGIEKHQFLDAGFPGTVDDIRFDRQVIVDEFGGPGVIGVNTAGPCDGQENRVRLLIVQPGFGLVLRCQVGFAALAGQPSCPSLRTSAAPTIPRCPATQTRLPARS